jgi:hypothetical protein
MHVLEPGWEVPDALPAGVTVAPAADPRTAARAIAERIGGELVVDVAAAERVLAREASRRRAARVVEDAAEVARLRARLAELSGANRPQPAERDETSLLPRLAAVAGDVTADADALLAAAARLRVATSTAEATRVVGDRPSTVAAEMELVRARSLVADVGAAAEPGRGGAATGALAMGSGGALLLVSAGVPVVAGSLLPLAVVAGLVVRRRRRRLVGARMRAEAEAAAAVVERAQAAWTRALDAEREWRSRTDAAAAASAEVEAARAAWHKLVGSDGVPVERAEAIADARRQLADVAAELGLDAATPATQLAFELSRRAAERARLEARLRDVLHGRRLDRLQAEADAARNVLAAPAPPAMVLCDPFAAVGRHRRRELFEDLERAAPDVRLAVVTSDDEAVAWATAKARSGGTAVTAAR